MGVDVDLRGAWREMMRRDYDEHTLLPGNRTPPVRRLESGSLALDYVMGGGYGFDRMTRLWGGFSSGKTLAMMKAFRSAQNFGELRYRRLNYLSLMARMGGEEAQAKDLSEKAKFEQDKYADGLKCLFIDAEGTFDPDQARKIGLRLGEDDLEVVRSKRIEEIGEIVQQALFAYHVICIDSTTDTLSVKEITHPDGVLNENLAMTRALKWQNNLAWWGDRMTKDNVIIYSSQMRTKIGMSARQKVEGEHAPGGNSLEHGSSCTLHFMKGSWLKRAPNGGLVDFADSKGKTDSGAFGKSQPAGSEVVVRCEKNKTARSHRVVLMHHDKRTGMWDPIYDLQKLGKYFKVLKQGGAWWTLPDGSKTQNIRERLETDQALANQIRDTVLRCSGDPAYEDQLLRGGAGAVMVPVLDD